MRSSRRVELTERRPAVEATFSTADYREKVDRGSSIVMAHDPRPGLGGRSNLTVTAELGSCPDRGLGQVIRKTSHH